MRLPNGEYEDFQFIDAVNVGQILSIICVDYQWTSHDLVMDENGGRHSRPQPMKATIHQDMNFVLTPIENAKAALLYGSGWYKNDNVDIDYASRTIEPKKGCVVPKDPLPFCGPTMKGEGQGGGDWASMKMLGVGN